MSEEKRRPSLAVARSLAFVTGAAAIFTGLVFRFSPAKSAVLSPRLDATHLVIAVLLTLAALAGAWIVRPKEDGWVMLGALPIAGALGLVMQLFAFQEPIVRDLLVPAGLETAGGFAVIAAALRWFVATRVGTIAVVKATKKKKARLRKTGGAKIEVPIEALSPGDEIELDVGDDVPVDGTIVSGSGFVDESLLTGPSLPQAKKAGDLLLAGSSSTIPDLVMRVGAPAEASLLYQREALARGVAEELSHAGTTGKLMAGFVTLLLVAGIGLILVRADLRIIEHWLPEATGLILASVAGAPSLALVSGRMGVLGLARLRGMIVARGKDVRILASVRRWQIDPRLLAAPGEVEVIAFGEESGDRLLAVTEALIAADLGPELPSVQEALRKKKIAPLPAAALRRSQAVFHGTVDGERWFLGPERAIEDEENVKIDPTMATTIEFLREKGLITWLIGRQDQGIIGAVGIGIAASPEGKSAAVALKATVMPGFPDATRQAVAKANGIECDGPPLGRTDGTVLYDSSPPPSTGLRVRVIRPRAGIELRSDRSPRILESSLAKFGDLIEEARKLGRRAQVRAVLFGTVPIALALALFVVGQLSPLVGAGIALATLLLANRAGRVAMPASEKS